ncbi:MAG: RsmE family RNA methyltransferase [candidate division Zixibacteria bacterium]|nr:RsmE family RNA methyltransferase [candidate division Zixibacteria bacterium]
MNLIILSDKDRIDEDHFIVSDNRAEHIRSILKLSEGDPVEIGILNGGQGKGKITEIDSEKVCLMTKKMEEVDFDDLTPQIDLICALPRPQTLKKVLLTCGMMAVRRLYLIRANRVEKSYYHSPLLESENYTPFLIEGLSQGKHTRLPEVTIHQRFKPFFEDSLAAIEKNDKSETLRIFPDPQSNQTINRFYDGGAARILLAIGPEGGWVPFETEMMQAHGFQMCTLGRWILRVEHAVTAALSQIEMIHVGNE